ncbi:MAG: DUF308 domain-containing protein [Eubacterium sp.]|nr:DUF308 domain-containing protein [Eubacterium sp.]
MNKKYLYLCLGAAAILLGIICIFNREVPLILCGIGLLLYSVSQLIHWRERRKAGAAGVWSLAGMLVAAGFGIEILIGTRLGETAIHFLLISLSIWLIAEGALEVLGAVMYRRAMTSVDLGVQAPGSVSSLVLGVIMIAVGVLGLIFPVFAAFAVELWIVAELIVTGVRMIWMARTAGALEESCE